MGNQLTRTVQTLRLDEMEGGSSEIKRTKAELAFLKQKLLEADSEQERLVYAREVEKAKRKLEAIITRSGVDIKVQ